MEISELDSDEPAASSGAEGTAMRHHRYNTRAASGAQPQQQQRQQAEHSAGSKSVGTAARASSSATTGNSRGHHGKEGPHDPHDDAPASAAPTRPEGQSQEFTPLPSQPHGSTLGEQRAQQRRGQKKPQQEAQAHAHGPAMNQQQGVRPLGPVWSPVVKACLWAMLAGLIGYVAIAGPSIPTSRASLAEEAWLVATQGWCNAVLFSAMVATALYPAAILAMVCSIAPLAAFEVYLPVCLLTAVLGGPYLLLPYFLYRLLPLGLGETAVLGPAAVFQDVDDLDVLAEENPGVPPTAAARLRQRLASKVRHILHTGWLHRALLAAAALLLLPAIIASKPTWEHFWDLGNRRLVVHSLQAELLVFALLAALVAAWDASVQRQAPTWGVGASAVLASIPVVGPGLYLTITKELLPVVRDME